VKRRLLAFWGLLGDDRLQLILAGMLFTSALYGMIRGDWIHVIISFALSLWGLRLSWKKLAPNQAPLPPAISLPCHLFDMEIDRNIVVWHLNDQGVEVTE